MDDKIATVSHGQGDASQSFSRSDMIALDAEGLQVLKRHTCILIIPADQPERVGSATIIRVGDHIVVSTARHVVEESELEHLGLFGWYDDDRNPIPLDGCRYTQADVAALLLNASVLQGSHSEGISLDRVSPNLAHVPNDPVVVAGTPGEGVRVNEQQETIDATFQALGSKTVQPEKWPDKLRDFVPDCNRDLFLYYSRDQSLDHELQPTKPTNPQGMSGGGIWQVPLSVPSGTVWSPNQAKLIGIQSAVESRKWKWLHGIQIQHLLVLIWNAWPFLRPAIEDAGFIVSKRSVTQAPRES